MPNLWVFEYPGVNWTYDRGIDKARTINDMDRKVIAWHGLREIEYTPLVFSWEPYQSHVRTNLDKLHPARWGPGEARWGKTLMRRSSRETGAMSGAALRAIKSIFSRWASTPSWKTEAR